MITKKSTNVLEEENYIKEGLVKIVVEMIKREWPQQWPSLLEELDQMCQIGDSQTELVLLILLRLVEDVVSFHNVQQSRRRKDLWQALTSNMAQISSFLIKVLEMYSEKYQSLETSAPQSNEAKSACKVTQTVLVTLCGFVEWMDAKHLFKEENRLLIFLYQLLRNEELKMLAAECLQLIVHRKGKIEERKPLMVLFCDVAMTELFNAAVKACSAGLDEKNHLFVKKLCQVITGLGSQMCAIWAIEGEVFEPPSNLASYLKTLYSFTQHASTHVCHLTSASWMAFLRHEHMPRTQAVLEIIPNLCQTYISTSQKIGYPSRNDSPACAYARIDFDSDDEFFHFFAAHRYYQLEILRHATGLCPETTFSIAARWLQELLAAPLEREEGKELCTNHSPSTIKWDAMSSYLDSVITTLIKKDQLPTQQAIELIQATLNCKIEDPVILSFQLTCISTLFPVLHHSNQHVEGVLDKLFAAAVYSWPGLTKKTRTRSVQNVRRHACSAMVKMCRDHQTLMLPHFEKIYTQVKRLCSDPEQLTQLERVTLSEALILINNGLHNWNRQSALIAEIMKPITDVWLSPHITEIIQSPESFIHNIGLDHPSDAQPNQEDVHNKTRAQIFSCISTSQAVVKRSCWPSDPQVAEAGGFISGHLPSGAPIYKNPSTPHILPILPNLFTLARTLNAMWSPECRGKVCPEYTRSYNMTENERNTILGLYGNSTEIPTNKPVVEKVQIFLTVVYETTCHLFADCFKSLGYEFFAAEGLSSQLLESIFTNLHHLPDYRLRHIIRVVTKGFVQSCPRECWQSVLVPVMTGLTSYMVHRLNQQWAIILQRAESGEAREEQNDEQETQEVLEDHLTRTVTKEFMELLGEFGKLKAIDRLKRLCSDPEQLTQLERVTLSEALILINNGLHNWNRQSALIAEIMKPITEVWLSPHITEIIQSPESFIHNIGLDHPSDAQPNQEDVHNKNRAQIFSCISTSQAVVKRSCWPSDPQVAAAGGFISGHLPSGAPIYKNPSTPHILPILPNLFTLARTLNAMWSPECRGKVCPEYTKSYNMTENERNTILGLYGNSTEIPTNKPVVEKVQIFLTVVYETTCHLFADCFQSLGYEFFAAEGLSSQLLESIFTNLHHLPDYRLRHIIRVVTKGFVQSCPRECWQSVLVPVMTGLTSFMVHRLNQQWAIILQRAESGEAREEQNDEQETQEVLEDHLTRTVTKEFMELLGNLCWSNNRTSSSSVTVKEEGGGGGGGELEMETEEAMEQGEGGAGNSAKSEPATISDLGKVILQNERLCESIVTCIYTAMSWPDSGVCMKACRLSWLIVQELATRPLLPEAVTHLYTSILRGLQIHGEHDTCRAELVYRAMNHYELLREKFPVLTEVMLSLPHCTQPALQKFHEKVPSSKPSEKKKREAFKSFIQSFIGVPVSQKFKRKEVIRDLPAIFKPMKPKLNVVDASVGAEEAGLVMLFASDADL
eukprot:XP_011670085.1 PREDICTED: exportin-5 [Strongylocentrotus purpuratus]